MFILQCARDRLAEKQYVADVVLEGYLGLEIRIEPVDGPVDWSLRLAGCENGSPALRMPDIFFNKAASAWLQLESLPDTQGPEFKAGGVRLPSCFSKICSTEARPKDAWLGFDVLGAAFFMLTRYEEQVIATRDRFERFAAGFSCLGSGYDPTEPVIDLAVSALTEEILRLWPRVRVASGTYQVMVTHDVDALRNRGRSTKAILAAAGADLLRRRSPGLTLRRLQSWIRRSSDSLDPADPFNTFGFLMTESERRGLTSHFYFVPEAKDTRFDPDYSVFDPDVQNLMGVIQSRGHQIGLHASFRSAFSSEGVANEFATLRRAAEAAGVQQSEWGGRHHYLRWRAGVSWPQWEDAGLDYDSSVGFAEIVGFRCGTSREFPVWDVTTGRRLKLREKPLIVMESTLFGYQGLEAGQALDVMSRLIARCRRHGGTLVLLWHNHNLLTVRSKSLYQDFLSAAVC